jgi:dGTPase
MEWKDLLKPLRTGYKKKEIEINSNPNRTEFQRDFDRIIFTKAFRRLNGKTQVFPFPETDMIHTRLTHSLETASVGRSLGTIVGDQILNDNNDLNFDNRNIGSIVSAACLAHDIGNPPLGHSGEKAIAEFFKSNKGKDFLKDLEDNQKHDFIEFEGNAMGFHILTYSNPNIKQIKGGMGLTYPTLAAFTKYPRPANINNLSDRRSEKKFGLFQKDMNMFKEIANELKILKKEEGDRWHRHPLAFLTEAADDICYGIMDLEDGYNHGLISYKKTSNLLIRICNSVDDNTDLQKKEDIINKKEKISYLRAKAINSLVKQAVSVFMEKEQDILSGTFDKSLIKLIPGKDIMNEIGDISSSQIYSNKSVLQVEAAGFQVLPGLLDIFLNAVKNNKKESSKKILNILPDEYIFNYNEDPYNSIMGILTYVAGMTDQFAVDTYRNFKGIQLPNY